MNALSHHRIAAHVNGPRFNLLAMLDVYRQRRALARLDDAALADIGLSRTEALAESRRALWDLGCR